MNYKKICSVLAVAVICNLCGCTQRQIVQPDDELTAFAWQNSDDYDKYIKLSFDENYAEILIKSYHFNGKIAGNVLTDNEHIEITDNSLNQKFLFTYKLYGDKTELSYNGNTVKLYKIN